VLCDAARHRRVQCKQDKVECDADRLVECRVREMGRQGRVSCAVRLDKRLV